MFFVVGGRGPEGPLYPFCHQIVVAKTGNRQPLQFLFQLPNPLSQELPLRFLLGQRQSPLNSRVSCWIEEPSENGA